MLPRTREAGGTHRIQVIAWQSVLLTGLRHSHPAHRYSRGISSWRRGHLSALRHGHPAHRYLRAISAWRRGHLSALRHGDPAYKQLSGIPAWQDGHLQVLRHGHHAHRHLSPFPAWQSIIQPVSDRSLSDALAGPSARRPSSKASQGLVLCNEYRSGDFRVREG